MYFKLRLYYTHMEQFKLTSDMQANQNQVDAVGELYDDAKKQAQKLSDTVKMLEKNNLDGLADLYK